MIKARPASHHPPDEESQPRIPAPAPESKSPGAAWTLGVSPVLYVFICLFGLALVVPAVRNYFTSMGLRWAYVLSIAFSFAFASTPLAAFVAQRFGVLDQPCARKLHRQATPLLGGAAVFIGFMGSLLANAILAAELFSLLGAATILFVVGIYDDWREMPAGLKLGIQAACAGMVMAAGIVLHVLPASWGIWGWAGNLTLTGMWIIGITNSMNFFDGMDGLAAGLGAIIAFLLAGVAFQTGQHFLGWIALAVLGSCLGFLPYNLRPGSAAAIFMGDAGSTVVGFVLACIAIYGDWAEGRPLVALVSPILIFWILIFDMVHITVDRVITGKVKNLRQWIEYVGKDHLHHRLAEALGSRFTSVLFIYLMNLCLGVSALMLRNAGPLEAMLLVLQASILVVLITVLERQGRLKTLSAGQGDLPQKLPVLAPAADPGPSRCGMPGRAPRSEGGSAGASSLGPGRDGGGRVTAGQP